MLGDRYILRDSGRGETVGGGEILDAQPLLKSSIALILIRTSIGLFLSMAGLALNIWKL